jgi:tRNA 2-thiouridine synthesizing protein D
MKFTLIVRNNHLQSGNQGLQFAQQLLAQQQQIDCIYFLFDGVYLANPAIDMPTDEPNLAHAWSEFSIQNNISLNICAASALRRGINTDNLAPGFVVSSIGHLVQSCDDADRVVSL